MKVFSYCGSVPVFMAALLLSGCAASTSDIPAVDGFELDRYLGCWYEIARLPHRFERNLDHVRAEYAIDPGGGVKVVNSGVRDGEASRIVGHAKLKYPDAPSPRGELRVSFFRPFYGDYRIIELDPEYRYAVVTGATRDYLWILSREPTMPEPLLSGIIGRMEKLGFAVEKLEFPRQDPVQGRCERHTSTPESR